MLDIFKSDSGPGVQRLLGPPSESDEDSTTATALPRPLRRLLGTKIHEINVFWTSLESSDTHLSRRYDSVGASVFERTFCSDVQGDVAFWKKKWRVSMREKNEGLDASGHRVQGRTAPRGQG